MLKFGQKVVRTKDFYGQRQIADLFTIDVNKVVVSDKVSCNNGCHCSSRHLKTYLFMVCLNTIKTLPIQCHSMFLKKKPGRRNIKRFGMRFSHSYLKKCRQNQ